MTAGAAPARAARRGRQSGRLALEGQGACVVGQMAGAHPTDGGSPSVRGDPPHGEGGDTEGGMP